MSSTGQSRSSGRIGLSEYTSQRLAELRARRAEVEADFKGQASGIPVAAVPTSPGSSRDGTVAPTQSPSTATPTHVIVKHSEPIKSSSLPPPPPPPIAADQHQNSTLSNTSVKSSNGDATDMAYRSTAAIAPATRRPQPGVVETSAVGRHHEHNVRTGDTTTVGRSVEPPTRQGDITPTGRFLEPVGRPVEPTMVGRSQEHVARSSATRDYKQDPTFRSPSADTYRNTSSPGTPNHATRHTVPTEDEEDCIGFASLPEQVHRKAVKRGFDFTLMVVGESGLGKSTLISSLFMNNELYKDRIIPALEERIMKTVSIDKKSMEIEEKGVKLRLTIVDTPGYNDCVNTNECWKPIEDYVEQQFDQYFKDETGLNRKNIKDNRVHCCLYFISPFGHGLHQIDVELMTRLQKKVNIVPVIAKADTLTRAEIKTLKNTILEEIEKHKIQIYEFPDCDSDEDEEFKQQDSELKASIPFAIMGSSTVVEVNGRKVRGRLYPWGIVEVDNPNHSDFSKLRQFLISTHMQDLKDVTRDVHYENFRARHIQEQLVKSQKERNKLKRDSSPNFEALIDTDQLLQQKDEEIQQMKEMLKKMHAQLVGNKGKQTGHLNGVGNL